MAELTLTADTGRPTGSRASGRLRATGKVPGVVYGLGADPVAVTVDWKALRAVLVTEAGLNALIDLHVGDEAQLVVVKEMQRHKVRRDVMHVDFLRVRRDVAISVDVHIVLHGEPEKVLKADGVIEQALTALTVNAKPGEIPSELVVDISTLAVGDVIRVGDITLPAGVTTDVDVEDPVISATMSHTAAEVSEAEELEVAALAEALEAEGIDPEAAAAEDGEGGEGGDGEAGDTDSGG